VKHDIPPASSPKANVAEAKVGPEPPAAKVEPEAPPAVKKEAPPATVDEITRVVVPAPTKGDGPLSPPSAPNAPETTPSEPKLQELRTRYRSLGNFEVRAPRHRELTLQLLGGNDASEAAVAKGLRWLVRAQKDDGRWDIDGTVNDSVAGTGLALLPFLAAGHAHKPMKGEKESPYAKTVEYGLSYIKGKQRANGGFGTRDLYGHAIATMALCESYGMTQDPTLKKAAQAGLDYLVKAQHWVGGFRYTPGQAGDTSVTGWCLQCMNSGQLAGFSVPREAMYKVANYLDTVQTQDGAAYGYTGPGATATMTAAGLLCREYLGWGPKNPKLVAGVENLKKNPPRKAFDNVYYYYYATQVFNKFGGDDWDKVWNPKMRDLLVDTQDNSNTANMGSWVPDKTFTGTGGGRLATTSLSLLTLEVYYRSKTSSIGGK